MNFKVNERNVDTASKQVQMFKKPLNLEFKSVKGTNK